MAQTIEGAIVIYMDAGAEFVADPSPLIKLADDKGSHPISELDRAQERHLDET